MIETRQRQSLRSGVWPLKTAQKTPAKPAEVPIRCVTVRDPRSSTTDQQRTMTDRDRPSTPKSGNRQGAEPRHRGAWSIADLYIVTWSKCTMVSRRDLPGADPAAGCIRRGGHQGARWIRRAVFCRRPCDQVPEVYGGGRSESGTLLKDFFKARR